jgi:plasmid replication initiation protein
MDKDLEKINSIIVRQSNYLIESPYTQEFTAHEIKLFEISLAQCVKNDYIYVEKKSDKEFSFSASELARLLHTRPSVISMEIEKTAMRIMKKTIHLRKILDDGSIEFEMINIIPYAKYKNGLLTFRLNYAIIPYLLEINKNFTEIKMDYLLNLNSAYAIKLYKLLYQYKRIGFRFFTIDELKEQFGLKDKYEHYKNFKQKVLEPSILQITTKTDLCITYEEIKLGRKVGKIEFKMKLQNKPIHPDFIDKDSQIIDIEPLPITQTSNVSKIDKLLSEIKSELSDKTRKLVIKFYEEKGIEFLEASIKYATKHAKSNLDKYLYDTLVNGWAEVELQKILDKRANEQKQLQISQQKQQEKEAKLQANQLNRSVIKSEWDNLTQEQQELYVDHSTNLLKKYNQKLNMFLTIVEDLPLCCYAVSKNKSYDLSIEGFCKSILNIQLGVN